VLLTFVREWKTKKYETEPDRPIGLTTLSEVTTTPILMETIFDRKSGLPQTAP
jgi:hypothetical protein